MQQLIVFEKREGLGHVSTQLPHSSAPEDSDFGEMMHLVEMALGKLPHEIKAFRIHLHNKNNMKDRKRGKREKQPRYFLEKLFNLLQVSS